MSFLNSNIPPIECYVRGNYLRNQEDSFDKKYKCLIFGITSLPSQVPLFNFLMEDGGIWWHAPISAFCSKEDAPDMELEELELWDSFSYHIANNFLFIRKQSNQIYWTKWKRIHGSLFIYS